MTESSSTVTESVTDSVTTITTLRELVSLVRAFVGFEVGFAINPVLARTAVPPLALSTPDATGAAGAGPLLGWNTWLPTSAALPRRTDADDAVFEGEIVEGHS